MSKATKKTLTTLLDAALKVHTAPWEHADTFHIVKLLNPDKYFINFTVGYSDDVMWVEKDPQMFIDRMVQSVVQLGDDVRVVNSSVWHNCYRWEAKILCRRWYHKSLTEVTNTDTLISSGAPVYNE